MKKQGMVVKSVVMLFVILVAVGCGGGGDSGSIQEQSESTPNVEQVDSMSTINGIGNDLPADMIVLFKKTLGNGETCVAGEMYFPIDGGRRELFASRYDTQGVRLWLQKLGNPKFAHYAQDMICTEDALYFLWGENDDETDKISGTNYTAYVSSYSKEGTLLWMTQVGIGGGMSNAMAGEGDYIFVVFQPPWDDPFISKINASEGNTLAVFSVEVSKDIAVYGDGIYICGSRLIDDIMQGDIFVYKYDFNGNLLWQRQWGQSQYTVENSDKIIVDADGVTVEGSSFDLIHDGIESYYSGDVVLKYDFDGNLLSVVQSYEK